MLSGVLVEVVLSKWVASFCVARTLSSYHLLLLFPSQTNLLLGGHNLTPESDIFTRLTPHFLHSLRPFPAIHTLASLGCHWASDSCQNFFRQDRTP